MRGMVVVVRGMKSHAAMAIMCPRNNDSTCAHAYVISSTRNFHILSCFTSSQSWYSHLFDFTTIYILRPATLSMQDSLTEQLESLGVDFMLISLSNTLDACLFLFSSLFVFFPPLLDLIMGAWYSKWTNHVLSEKPYGKGNF
jgi:hypothetical protein